MIHQDEGSSWSASSSPLHPHPGANGVGAAPRSMLWSIAHERLLASSTSCGSMPPTPAEHIATLAAPTVTPCSCRCFFAEAPPARLVRGLLAGSARASPTPVSPAHRGCYEPGNLGGVDAMQWLELLHLLAARPEGPPHFPSPVSSCTHVSAACCIMHKCMCGA
ncbi:hypothetical protein ZWY2020_035704 [Hordeum vulgare]|nr:hypothetical protein ZWY2020_035704 [Hordeum vulgare]